LDELPRDRPIFVICQSGYRSLRASQFLRQAGFERVATIAGGTAEWLSAGKPVERGAAEATGHRVVESEWAHAGVGIAATTAATQDPRSRP